MRKLIGSIGILVMMFSIAGIATVAKDEKTMTWTGYISDSACGVKNANTAAGKQCAMQCVEGSEACATFP